MDVIFNAVDKHGRAAEFQGDARQIGVRGFRQIPVREEWCPVFGGENQMHENGGKGLRHGWKGMGKVREGVRKGCGRL